MKDLKDQSIGMNTSQKEKQKQQIMIILQDFLLILLFKELIDSLFLLLKTLIMVITKLKETVTENNSCLE